MVVLGLSKITKFLLRTWIVVDERRGEELFKGLQLMRHGLRDGYLKQKVTRKGESLCVKRKGGVV